MKEIIPILFLIIISYVCSAPVRKTEEKPALNVFSDLHYSKYLEEVIKELEKDKAFSEKLKEAQSHNRTEHIAQSLLFVNHKVRNKLDEIKRREIERLNILENELERKKLEAGGGKVRPPSSNLAKLIPVDKDHLDHKNIHTFEISDLEKLIRKTEEDLEKIDKEQEEQYKTHEMKKEYLKNKKLESIKDAEERKKLEEQFKESEKRHKNHSKIHHPGSEEQLKEVWDKTDHLDPNGFNPKAFFSLHDVNGDDHLDINEIEALMQNELAKVYDGNNTDDDMVEKYHEMMRMRQEMMTLMDKNKDNMVSRDEFMKFTGSEKFKDDSAWKTQEEENSKPYDDKEYKAFEDDFSQHEDDDDYFSDQDDSLRYIPRHAEESPQLNKVNENDKTKADNQNSAPPSGNLNVKADNQNSALPSGNLNVKADNQNGAPPKL